MDTAVDLDLLRAYYDGTASNHLDAVVLQEGFHAHTDFGRYAILSFHKPLEINFANRGVDAILFSALDPVD